MFEVVIGLVVDVPHAKVTLVDEGDVLRPTCDYCDLVQHAEEFFDRFGRLPSDCLDLVHLVQGHLADCGEVVSIRGDIHLGDAGDLGITA